MFELLPLLATLACVGNSNIHCSEAMLDCMMDDDLQYCLEYQQDVLEIFGDDNE